MKKLCVEITASRDVAADDVLVTASQLEGELNARAFRGIRFSVRELPAIMEEPEYDARSLIVCSLALLVGKRALTQRHVDQCTAIVLALSDMAKDNISQLIELAELSSADEAYVRKAFQTS